MKKAILLTLAAALLSLNAGAQVFNHVALGVGVGTDGLSLEAAAPLGRHIDVRAGYGNAFGLIGFNAGNVSLPQHPGDPNSANANVPIKVNLINNDARLLFNIYPSATGGFHFTVGAFLGSPAFASGTLTGMPSDYNTIGFDVDGYLVKAQNGELPMYLYGTGFGSSTFAVKPYVGIGFGRAVDPDKRVSFSFDLGAQYQGMPTIWADGESVTGRIERVQIDDQIEGMSDTVDEYGKYLQFMPTLTFHLFVRLF